MYDDGLDKLWDLAQENVYVKSVEKLEGYNTVVKGYDFNEGLDYKKMFETYSNMGF